VTELNEMQSLILVWRQIPSNGDSLLFSIANHLEDIMFEPKTLGDQNGTARACISI
jgi:hypothetical protein